MTVKQLRDKLGKNRLDTGGLNAVLVARYAGAIS